MESSQLTLSKPKGPHEIEHRALIGQSGCGKTGLAAGLARTSPRTSIWYTLPFRPGGKFIEGLKIFTSDDEQRFLRTVWSSKNLDVFIDEVKFTVGHYNKPMIQIANVARNQGHRVFFLAQRLTHLHPDLVEACSWLYAFRMGKKSAEKLAEEFSCEAVASAYKFEKLQYIEIDRYSPQGEIPLRTVSID